MTDTSEYENDKDYWEALELLDEEYSIGRVTPYIIVIKNNIDYELPIEEGCFSKMMTLFWQ